MKLRTIRAALISLYLSPIALVLWLWMSIASAGVTCTLPFNLQNGTTADATQVMANYNALVTCLQNSAAAGSNSDITSLIGLTTPITPNEGGSSVFLGSTATNVANVYSFTTTIPTNFSLSVGNIVSFLAPSANTGPTQVNAAGSGATNLFRQSPTGPVAMVGGEIQPNQVIIAFYDGVEYQCVNCPQLSLVPTGTVLDFSGIVSAIPPGFLFANGQALSRTNFGVLWNTLAVTGVVATTLSGNPTIAVPNSSLFQIGWYVGASAAIPCNSAIISIPDGTHITLNNNATSGASPTISVGPYQQGDCSLTFNVPNYNGKVLAGVDGTTNITSASCINAGSIGDKQAAPNVPCGNAFYTVLRSDLPNVTVTATGTSQFAFSFGSSSIQSGSGIVALISSNLATPQATFPLNGGVTQTQVNKLSPTSLVFKIIKT